MCNKFTSICIETACIETTLYRNDREPWVCFIYNGDLFSLWYGIGIETIWSNVSLYRIDFTCVTNLLQFVSKRLISKRLCIETTLYRNDREPQGAWKRHLSFQSTPKDKTLPSLKRSKYFRSYNQRASNKFKTSFIYWRLDRTLLFTRHCQCF